SSCSTSPEVVPSPSGRGDDCAAVHSIHYIARVRWPVPLLVVLALFLGGAATAGAQTGPPATGGRGLLAVRPTARVTELIVGGFDLWEADADRALVLVDTEDWDRLTADGFDLTVLRRFPATRRALASQFGPGAYHGYDAVVSELQAVQKAHPDIV